MPLPLPQQIRASHNLGRIFQLNGGAALSRHGWSTRRGRGDDDRRSDTHPRFCSSKDIFFCAQLLLSFKKNHHRDSKIGPMTLPTPLFLSLPRPLSLSPSFLSPLLAFALEHAIPLLLRFCHRRKHCCLESFEELLHRRKFLSQLRNFFVLEP